MGELGKALGGALNLCPWKDVIVRTRRDAQPIEGSLLIQERSGINPQISWTNNSYFGRLSPCPFEDLGCSKFTHLKPLPGSDRAFHSGPIEQYQMQAGIGRQIKDFGERLKEHRHRE